MTQEQLRMQMLAGIITEGQYKAKLNENMGSFNILPIKLILSSDISPEEKMDQIGDFMTDTEEGQNLSNTNLGSPVDEWFDTKTNATEYLTQIQTLVNNPVEIVDISSDLY